MHSESDKFADAQDMIAWCKDNDVKHLPRQLDHGLRDTQFNYNKKQTSN